MYKTVDSFMEAVINKNAGLLRLNVILYTKGYRS